MTPWMNPWDPWGSLLHGGGGILGASALAGGGGGGILGSHPLFDLTTDDDADDLEDLYRYHRLGLLSPLLFALYSNHFGGGGRRRNRWGSPRRGRRFLRD
ncbi:hypothetical protein Tdes44962_MAKER00308 [Teratosphaeria destructans]|uniref:Uncharacterized protein n=1 Tax=Teratosphaeria destructans TaxID=418781 RepID=A0A9W7SVK6_9PEZI|nr:hypothetical protein Tdes44962_MAKER00308 [Teratosphaeria destructans]